MDEPLELRHQHITILQQTGDGSHTLFVPQIEESYHSTHGAIQESAWIFIKEGFQSVSKDDISVLEIGFGTGLNAFLTALEAEKANKTVHYTTLEKYPLSTAEAELLNFPQQLNHNDDLFQEIHKALWEKEVQIRPYFHLNKICTDFTTFELSGNYDMVYFDAFSPEKQPEMWAYKGFKQIFEHCNPRAVLTTYCAKGSVRRALQGVGYVVQRIPGPPGKREILRAVKMN